MTPISPRALRAAIMAATVCGTAVAAQAPVPITRDEAVTAAVERGARLAVARADTAAASAQLLTARAFENPTLTTEYSKSTPQYHVLLDLPIDYPWLRRARVGSALAGRRAAQLRFASERAAAALDADTTYTRALAARAHRQLSERNAAAADTLHRMAIARRDAGDAADLDVELAAVNAGEQANAAASDSLAFVSTLLDLQAVMGLDGGTVALSLADTLGTPPADAAEQGEAAPPAAAPAGRATGADSAAGRRRDAVPLPVAAAAASVESARLAAELQRRSVWPVPSLTAGIETGDPTGAEPGLLPVFGIGLPLPLFNRNGGPIAQAQAERARAEAELLLARVESRNAIAHARRELALALAKVGRDRALVESADRVAAMSLTAYREGASTLPNVLEAQRSARDVFAAYVDDLAAAWIASSTLRFLTLAPTSSTPR